MRLFDSVQAANANVISTRPKRYRGQMSRVGVFPYVIDNQVVWQYRPAEEVFNTQSMESLIDAVMTIEHPTTDDDSALALIHGSVINVNSNQETQAIDGDFVLLTKESEILARNGSPLSPMYDADILEESGTFNGQPYGFIQRNIRYSSLGLVSEARQGNTVKVYYQLSKDSADSITETGIVFNASIITTQTMTTNKVIKDSIAALDAPVTAPSFSTQGLAEIIPVESPIDLVIDRANTADLTGDMHKTVDLIPDPEPESATLEPVESVTEAVTPTEDLIAQITDVGGVLVNRTFLNDVISVAKDAVAHGIMSLEDAIYYGQANIASVKKAILDKVGVELQPNDDINTAYRIFARVSQTTIPPEVGVKQTIGDSLATVSRSAPKAAVSAPSFGKVAVSKPVVTHPATTQTRNADSAQATGLVSFDSIGL